MWPFKNRPAEEPAPEAGEFGVAPGVVREILGQPARAAAIVTARSRLTDLSPDHKVALIDRVVARFALTVVHLPASATYHHAGAWGLLDHSLEVAVRALTTALEMRFSDEKDQDPGREYDLLPRWRYAAFLFGLLHDVGKVTQLIVEAPDGAVWNPFVEPLAAFLHERSLWPPERSPAAVSWRPGRSLSGHERHNTFFVSRILTPEAARYLGGVLPLALEQASSSGVALAAAVTAADTESVVAERRARFADPDAAEEPRPAFIASVSSVADYVPVALQRALESGLVTLNAPGADAFIGDHYVALRYPGSILKVMEVIRERWKDEDARARHLRLDQTGVKLFMRELSYRQFVFKDRASGTWKLKATVEVGADRADTFLVLVKKEILEAAAFRLFPGCIRLYSIVDQSAVAVDDFSVAEVPGLSERSESKGRATSAPAATPPTEQPPSGAPNAPTDAPVVPSYVDPHQLLATLRDLVLSGRITTNVPKGACFVAGDVTYLVWPRGLVPVREALGLPFNPMDVDRRPYTTALAQLPAVQKNERGNVIATIKFRPDSEKVCRVVKFSTELLFPEPEDRERLGVWAEADLIVPAPPEARVERRMPA